MQILRNPFFILFCCLFWLTYLLEYFHVFTLPVIHNYLDDVLAIPVILTLAVAIQRQWVYRNKHYTLSKIQIIFAVVYVSVLFEGVLPLCSLKYTRDLWDILAYFAGAFIFNKLLNRPKKISSAVS